MKIRLAMVLMATLAMAMCAGLAHASTYQLTVDNCSGGCNPGAPGTSMGTVVVTGQGTTTLTIVVTLVSPLNFVNTGIVNTIDFNLSSSPTIALGSTSNANFSLDHTTAGSDHFDGLGNFMYSLQLAAGLGQGAGSAQPSPETFTITCAACSLQETANSNGFVFGVDVINTTTGRTGPIGTSGGTPTPTPEPGTLFLFGSGLIGVAGLIRRKLVS